MLKVSISLGSANSSQKIIISFFIFSSTYWIVISAKVLLKATLFLSHPMQAYHKGLLGAWLPIVKDLSGDSLRSSQASIRVAASLWSHACIKKYGIYLEYISQDGWYIQQDCLQESPGETLLRLLPSLPTSLVICKNDCLFLLHPTNQPSNQPSNQTCLSLPLPPPPLLLAASCTPQSMVVIITW